jgi:predicted transcriptional regulator
MSELMHPAREDFSLTRIMAALGDATRFAIVCNLHRNRAGLNCGLAAAPFAHVPRSTLTSHFRVLREAGLIRMTKKGVEFINTLRFDDLETQFPGLLPRLMAFEERPAPQSNVA